MKIAVKQTLHIVLELWNLFAFIPQAIRFVCALYTYYPKADECENYKQCCHTVQEHEQRVVTLGIFKYTLCFIPDLLLFLTTQMEEIHQE